MSDEPDPGTEGQEPEEELFPSGSLDGETIQPQQVIKKGTPVEVTVSIGKAEVPLRSGMIDPNKAGRALVSYAFLKNEDVPHFEGEGSARKITRWKIRTHLTATYVEPANDEADLGQRRGRPHPVGVRGPRRARPARRDGADRRAQGAARQPPRRRVAGPTVKRGRAARGGRPSMSRRRGARASLHGALTERGQ